MSKKTKTLIDISMILLLPLLMAYSLIGEAFHEVIGTIMFLLFIVHHVLNRTWYGVLIKGKYNARRIFQTALDLFLLVFMILQPVSGVVMSKHLYAFLPALSVASQARIIHMMLAYWGYALLSIHAGTHLVAPIRKLFLRSKKIHATVCVVLGCVSVYGCTAFFRRGFPGYLFGRMAFVFFDYSEPKSFFFTDYIAIMVLFMVIGCLIVYWLSRIDTKRKAVEK